MEYQRDLTLKRLDAESATPVDTTTTSTPGGAGPAALRRR